MVAAAAPDEVTHTQQQAIAAEDAVSALQVTQRAGTVGECSQLRTVSWMAQVLQPPPMRAAPRSLTRVRNAWNVAPVSTLSTTDSHRFRYVQLAMSACACMSCHRAAPTRHAHAVYASERVERGIDRSRTRFGKLSIHGYTSPF